MIEETPVASRDPAERRKADGPLCREGRADTLQIPNQFPLHDSAVVGNFRFVKHMPVGNIPLAFRYPRSDNSVMEKNELRQRIRERLQVLGLGPVEAATAVPGLERNFIRDLLDGKKHSIRSNNQPLVAQALQWSVPDLLGPQPRRTMSGAPKLTMVPLLDRVAAGRLKSPSSQIPVEDVPLLAFADLGRGEFFALTVEGDSMDRYSPEGSTIIVNKAERNLLNGRCYVFSIKGDTTYKMWQGGDNPHLAPYSTNPSNKPLFFKKNDFEVIGRVKRTLLDL